MFDKLLKYANSAKEALEVVCKKRSASTKPSEKKPDVEPEAATEKVETPQDDKPFKKPDFPIKTVVILAAIIIGALYVEWHLLALTMGIWLALVFVAYLVIQKAIDAANLAVPDPGDGPGPWPWPTSDDTGGYQGA